MEERKGTHIVVLQLDDEWLESVVHHLSYRFDDEVARVISITREEEASS